MDILSNKSTKEQKEGNLKISVLSDAHYFSKSMIKDCIDFTIDKYSDRKLLEESSDIFDSSLEMIEKDKPDVLLISGDLTKDGEEKCEREVAAKLKNLQDICLLIICIQMILVN